MFELTDVMTRASCELQSTCKFPWEYSDIIKDLIKKLTYVKECFDEGLIPDIQHESYKNLELEQRKKLINKDKGKVKTKDTEKKGDEKKEEKKKLIYSANGLGKQPWSVMKKFLPSNTNDSFQDVPVLMNGELGCKNLRSWLKKSNTNDIDSEVKDVLKEISDEYIAHLIKYLNGYSINGKNPANVDNTLPLPSKTW